MGSGVSAPPTPAPPPPAPQGQVAKRRSSKLLMKPLTEKRYNAAINVWIREPALVVTATLGFVQLHTHNQAQFGWGIGAVRIFLMLLAMWNGKAAAEHRHCHSWYILLIILLLHRRSPRRRRRRQRWW